VGDFVAGPAPPHGPVLVGPPVVHGHAAVVRVPGPAELPGAARPPGRWLTAWLAERCTWPGASLLFGVPISLALLALKAAFPDEHDWGEFAWYLAFFLVGYVLVSDPRFLAAVKRDLVPALVVGVVGFAILGALDPFGWVEGWAADPGYTPSYFLMLGLFSLQGWAWAVAALSVGMRVSRFRQPLPGVVADAAMP
jgi:hypothetical protein